MLKPGDVRRYDRTFSAETSWRRSVVEPTEVRCVTETDDAWQLSLGVILLTVGMGWRISLVGIRGGLTSLPGALYLLPGSFLWIAVSGYVWSQVAQEASCFVQADFVIMAYLAQDRKLMDLVTKALHANRGHWSVEVRSASEKAFDLLLDFL